MEKKSIVEVGGNIERALKGDYTLDVENIIKEAWQQTLRSRLSINLGLLFSFSLGIIVTLLVSNNMGGLEQVAAVPESMMLLNIIITIVIWPFLAGVEMMGVFHSVGMKTKTSLIFSFLKRGSWVALCALLTSIFISIGFSLLVIPGIFLAVSFSLTIPLVVEKNMSPIKACWVSIQATRFQWFKMFVAYALLAAAFLLICLPFALLSQTAFGIFGLGFFFLGLTFLAPLFYNVKGILYREIFGLHLSAGVVRPQHNSTFIA